jgi:hypothetical protein
VQPRYVLAGILLAIPVLVYLMIPLYDKRGPVWEGLPFFYWWQTLWLGLTAVFFVGAALLIDWGEPDEVYVPS